MSRTRYFVGVGAEVICAEMVANPMQLYTEDGGQSLAGPDEIQFLLTIRSNIYGLFLSPSASPRVHRNNSGDVNFTSRMVPLWLRFNL